MKKRFRLELTLSDELQKGGYLEIEEGRVPELGDSVLCSVLGGLACQRWCPGLEGVLGVIETVKKPVEWAD